MTKATIRFECPGCEKSISFAVEDIGTVQECPHCGGYVDVPGEKDDRFVNDPDDERQRAQYEQQLDDFDRQTKEIDRQNEVIKHQGERANKLLDKDEELKELQIQLCEKWSQTQIEVDQLVAKWQALADRVVSFITKLEDNSGGPG